MDKIIKKILSFVDDQDVLIYEYKTFYSVANKNGESFVFNKNGIPEAMNFSEKDPKECKNPKLIYKN